MRKIIFASEFILAQKIKVLLTKNPGYEHTLFALRSFWNRIYSRLDGSENREPFKGSHLKVFQRGIPHFTTQGAYMTKAELIEKIAKDAEITKVMAETAVKTFLDGVTSALKAGDKVTFMGFGSFSVSDRKARTGRNPQTGKEIKIPARKAVSFTVGKALKEAVQAPAKKTKKNNKA